MRRAETAALVMTLAALAAMETTHTIRGRRDPVEHLPQKREPEKPRRFQPDPEREQAAEAKRARKAAARARVAARHAAAQQGGGE